ncbi:YodC family protein [Palleronia sp.]|uniref:YodC family protein n=1 Tax=Palleronia sp. TaxID=1940284 RepID=UPI0035C7F0F2
MAEDLKPGDLVRLKSGGPVMTYEGDSEYRGPICVWFDGSKMKRECFTLTALEKADK